MNVKEKNIWGELERGLGGGSKLRILLRLVLNPKESFTIYSLVKATGLRTPSVKAQLSVLLDLGWVKEYQFTPKTYQININNKYVKHFSDFLKKVKY